VTLRTVEAAIHSGVFGGPIMDPLISLCKLLGTIHDDKGAIQIRGFDTELRPIQQNETENIATLNYTEAKLREESRMLSSVKVAGAPNLPILNKEWFLPTCTAIGLDACAISESAPKILASATARLSCRIAANQKPADMLKFLKDHLTAHVPYGCEIKFSNESELAPWVWVPEGDVYQAAIKALKDGYNHDPVLTGSGGAIGFVGPFADAFGGAPAILIGVEDPYTNAHGENESLNLADHKSAILSLVNLFYNLVGVKTNNNSQAQSKYATEYAYNASRHPASHHGHARHHKWLL